MKQTINTTTDARRFLVINTVEYNGDGKYTVQDTDFEGLKDLGFLPEELEEIDPLVIGDTADVFAEPGVYVMRVA